MQLREQQGLSWLAEEPTANVQKKSEDIEIKINRRRVDGVSRVKKTEGEVQMSFSFDSLLRIVCSTVQAHSGLNSISAGATQRQLLADGVSQSSSEQNCSRACPSSHHQQDLTTICGRVLGDLR